MLNASLTPPFQIDDENLSETVRLEHRVLDLRRPQMQKNLMLRYRTAMAARRYLDEHGFIDIETPTLYKSTPEGAREFLVPSRIHHGQFYALPQSPQLFKQMLMMAGFDRYYQIVKCFRDEDLRADRQPEFTQIDIETSFLTELDIRELMEGLVRAMFKDALGVELPNPFPVMTFAEAMAQVRLRQARPARAARADRADRPHEDRRLQGLPRGGRPAQRPRRGAARAGRRHAVAQGDRRLHGVRQDLRRRRPRVHQGQRRDQGERGRPAVAGRQVPARARAARDPRAHRRARTATSMFFGADREKVVNDALGALRAKVGHDRGLRREGLEAAVGRRLPDVRVRRGEEDLGRAPPSVHRAQGRPRGPVLVTTRASRSRRPTTSC